MDSNCTDDIRRRLQKLFYFTSEEAARLFDQVRVYRLPRVPPFPAAGKSPTSRKGLIRLVWIPAPEPLIAVRAADLPELSVLLARLIAGNSEA
jgi:hypothetical protein